MYDSRTDRRTIVDAVGEENYTGDTPWQLVNKAGWHAHSMPERNRKIKRLAAKYDRRSKNPRTQFRGYGWGDMNMNYGGHF